MEVVRFRGAGGLFCAPQAVEALGEVLAALLSGRNEDDPFRAWVPGCSTGQEAYSLAILVAEQLDGARSSAEVQIFATDEDATALEVARAGLFPASIAADVPPERLERHFSAERDCYRVSARLREMIVFAPHRLAHDPPFSGLDVVICRDHLVHMEPRLQQRLVTLFHYALREQGCLFLGTSEGVGDFGFGDLFDVVDRENRIFRKRPIATPGLQFPSALRTPDALSGGRSREPDLQARIARVLLRLYAPPSVLVSETGEIRHIVGHTSPYLELPDGQPSLDLYELARPSLREELRAAVHRAMREHVPVICRDLCVPDGDGMRRVTLHARPLEREASCLVSFEEPAPAPSCDPAAAPAEALPADVLAQELMATRSSLHTAVAELEIANEELTASNEELLSVNEELQSANEELETSKEEVQSINEELNERVAELTRTNNDISNLLASTQVATLFLDSSLRVARFTPAMRDLYHLQSSDVGRPIDHLKPRLAYPDLARDAADVLEKRTPHQREVRGIDGTCYLARLLPYRTLDNRIEGIVATFIDVTALKNVHEELSAALARAHLYEQALDESSLVTVVDEAGTVLHANGRFCELLGRERRDVVGRPHLAGGAEGGLTDLLTTTRSGRVWRGTVHVETKHGRRAWLDTTAVPVQQGEGEARVMVIQTDATERMQALRWVEASEARFRAVFEQSPMGILISDLEDRIIQANPAVCRMLGYSAEELRGRRFEEYVHPEDSAAGRQLLDALLEGERSGYEVERRFRGRHDAPIRGLVAATTIAGDDGPQSRLVLRLVQDVTAARQVQERLRAKEGLARLGEMAAVVSHELRNALGGIRGAVEVIGRHLPENEPRREALGEVRARVDSLETMVQDLLRFARRPQPKLSRIRLRSIVEHAAAALQTDPAYAKLSVEIAGDEIEVECDSALLERALHNVMLNGAQAMEASGILRVSLETEAGKVVLRIRDEGPGIAAQVRDTAFEPFVTSRHRGTGLGLAIAKAIVDSHRGRIGMDDHPGGGTVVTIELPAPP